MFVLDVSLMVKNILLNLYIFILPFRLKGLYVRFKLVLL